MNVNFFKSVMEGMAWELCIFVPELFKIGCLR